MLNPSGYSVQVLSLLLASSMTTKELALALGEAGYGYDSVRVKVAKMARVGLIYKQGNRLSPWLIAERGHELKREASALLRSLISPL